MIKRTTLSKRVLMVVMGTLAVLFLGAFPRVGQASPAQATAPVLGTAAFYAVLGGSTVTNTGPSLVSGNLGVWPGTAITGFPPGVVIPPGTIHVGDASAHNAQNDVTAAYNNLAGQACNFTLTGQDLGGKTLIPGVYCFASSAQLTGALTLDGQGNPNAVFIFQIGSTLTTASNSSVLLINGASACNVYWQVGSSATLGTTTTFAGNILALQSITLNTGASITGRALARNGAVTMDSNRVDASQCLPAAAPTSTATVGRPIATTTLTPIASPVPTLVPATATPISATSTAVAAATATSIAAATSTAVAIPTATALAAATNTAIAAPTVTAVAAATNTAIAAATSTAVSGPTSTAIAAATSTAVAAAGATSTAVAGATSTAVIGATATPTSRPASGPTATAIATQVVSHGPAPRPVPIPREVPHTGGGGTALFPAPSIFTPQRSAPSQAIRTGGSPTQSLGVTSLPRTGGGGDAPMSPLAPFALIGALAILIAQLMMRAHKR